jgi:hypothetical protein
MSTGHLLTQVTGNFAPNPTPKGQETMHDQSTLSAQLDTSLRNLFAELRRINDAQLDTLRRGDTAATVRSLAAMSVVVDSCAGSPAGRRSAETLDEFTRQLRMVPTGSTAVGPFPSLGAFLQPRPTTGLPVPDRHRNDETRPTDRLRHRSGRSIGRELW